MAISMLKIRRPLGRLIFNMGIAIPGKTVFLIETAPWTFVLIILCDRKSSLSNSINAEVSPCHDINMIPCADNLIYGVDSLLYVGRSLP